MHYTALLKGRLRLSARGEWWHDGRPFTNTKLSALFHRSIIWSGSEYMLEIGRQRATFDLEDTAYFVMAVTDAESPWRLRFAHGAEEVLVPEALASGPAGELYYKTSAGHWARFSRAAHQAVLAHVDDTGAIVIGSSAVHPPLRSGAHTGASVRSNS